jgi:hypothetical protein
VEGSLAFLSLVGSFLIILSAMFVKVPCALLSPLSLALSPQP